MTPDVRGPTPESSAEATGAAPTAATPYRAEALAANESSERLDELLPVTSLRLWLLAVAAVIIVAAGIAYTAITPRNVKFTGEGRVVGDGGIGLVTATADGQLGTFSVEPGTRVEVGQKVAEIITADGPVPQFTQVEGTLLGYIPSAGAPLKVGDWLSQVSLTVDDGTVGLITVLPEEAAKVQEGQTVTVSIDDGSVMPARIGPERSPVLSAARIQEGMGTLDPPSGPRVAIEVMFDEPAPTGYEFTGVILVSERTLLEQLLGLS